MSNKNCGPDIVKYFVVEPAGGEGTTTGSTGNFYVCQGTTFLRTISGCTDSVNLNGNIFYNENSSYNPGDVYFNGVITACTGIHTSTIRGCSPITVYDRLVLLDGLTLTGSSVSEDNSLTQILARDSVSGLVKYINFSAITIDNTLTNVLGKDPITGQLRYRTVESIISAATAQDTFVTGTTFSDNQAVLTRNDGFDVLFLTGGTNVTLSNPSTNQIKLDVSIPVDTNTFVTGFTYDDINTFTIGRNDGIDLTSTISILSGVTYYGDGSNLTGIGDNFVSGGTYNPTTLDINFVGNSSETTFDVGLASLVASVSGDTDTFVTGFTFNNSTYDLTIKQNEGQPDLVSNLAVLASDVYVLSGVYNPSTGIVTYTNSSGGTFQVSGFTTGMTDSYTTDAYLNGTEIRFDNNIQGANFYNVDLISLLSGKTDNTTFNTYTANTQTILGGKVGGGVNFGGGHEVFSGKSGTDLYFRTLSGGSNTTISTIGDVVKVDVTIPADINTFVTGFTYNDANTFTISRNDGVNLSASINTMTGLTVNGSISATTYFGDGSNLTGISTDDNFVTGGTLNSGTLTLERQNGIVTITGFTTDLDTYVTGGTVSVSATDSDNSGTIGLFYKNSDGIPRTLPFEDTFTTGATYDNGTALATFKKNDGTSYTLNLSTIDVNDTFVTGTTFSSNQAIVRRNDGADVFLLTGGTNITLSNTSTNQIKIDASIPAGANTFVTGGTYNDTTDIITLTRNDGGIINITGVTDTFVTGTTFTSNQAIVGRNDGFDVLSLSGTNDVTLTNPSSNQIVIDVNGLKYFISETNPTGVTLSNGYRWFNTSIGSEFVYIDDGDSSQWVQPLIQPGPQGPQGPSGNPYFITTGITTSAETLTTGFTYYGVSYVGDVDLTLPDPTGIDGFNFTVKDEGGNAGTYRIRLIPSVGLIDGNTSVDMANNYMGLYLVARNNNWWII